MRRGSGPDTRNTAKLYKVVWGRAGWTHDQQRIYMTRHAAQIQLDKLRGDDRPDLAPIVRLELHVADRTPWRRGRITSARWTS